MVRYAAVSELWILFHTFKCRKVRAIDELFKIYGPVVRISSNTVAFLDSDPEQRTTCLVYNALKLDKGPLYDAVHMNGHLHSVAIIEHHVHAKYRRIFSSHYSPGNISLLHPEVKASAQVFVRYLDYGALEAWSKDDIILKAIEDYGRLILLSGILPKWLMSIVSHFPNERWQVFCISGDTLFTIIGRMVHNMQTQKDAGTLDEREKPTLVQRFFAHNDSCALEDKLSFEDMASESMTHLLAGVDASAVVFSYILWQFANQPPEVQKRIQAELDTAMPDPMVVPDLKVLQDALFKEGMRLHGPIPTFLERRSPRGGPLDLLGFKVPPRTVIGTQSWSMHRNEAIFENPEVFDVFRWLDPNKPQDAMLQALNPYGLGTRICIGQHLSRAANKTTLAAVLRNFDIAPCEKTDSQSMEMMELFGMFPVGLSCHLNFNPRV
ncbi:hypothetical protein D9757_003046 [Collybiopsis confluens]|uniref:Cytochrome P450 n=1 Tax=Collybiopsis confluens TaxID=2823264 RepID=A0A8H5HXS1_9AGAR|nr:hypothetical protein D9757_003046 [Collybiopsis confluens]